MSRCRRKQVQAATAKIAMTMRAATAMTVMSVMAATAMTLETHRFRCPVRGINRPRTDGPGRRARAARAADREAGGPAVRQAGGPASWEAGSQAGQRAAGRVGRWAGALR